MVDDPALQWILTVLFAATAVVSALAALRRPRGLATVGHVLHLLMSLVMIAMCWPWWFALPHTPQLVVFVLATAWYLGLVVALLLPVSHAAVHARGEAHGVWHQVMHAVMMGAMVWMLVAMGGGAMAGGGDGHHHHSLSTALALSGIAFVAGLVVSVVVMSVDLALDRGRRRGDHHRVETTSAAAMCAGMAAMCWPMIVG